MQSLKTTIRCPYFIKQDEVICRLSDAINKSAAAVEKKSFVNEYLEEIGVLLNCSEFSHISKKCRDCNSAMALRKESGELILKALELSNSGG